MEIIISESRDELGAKAASMGAKIIQECIKINGHANIIVATGTSQFGMLNALIKKDIDWSKVTCFHLDEYIGMTIEHPASFRKYLKERLVSKVNLKEFHYINADVKPEKECERLNKIIAQYFIDVAFIGIGENGHLAFNDPPANFEIDEPYIIVSLDDACRKQQMGEGWFNTLEDVPQQAISMSIQQILKSKNIICSVPDARKSNAVRNAIKGEITPMVPSSILQKHDNTWIYLDKDSAGLLL